MGLHLQCRYNLCALWNVLADISILANYSVLLANYFVLEELQMNEISTHIPGFWCDVLICWLLFALSLPRLPSLTVLAMAMCRSIFKLPFFHRGQYVLLKNQKQK